MGLSVKRVTQIASKLTPTDVRTASGKIVGAMKTGYKSGRVVGAGRMSNAVSQSKSVAKELRKLKFTAEEYPALVASVVALIPIPSPIPITPIVYGVGKAVQKITKLFK